MIGSVSSKVYPKSFKCVLNSSRVKVPKSKKEKASAKAVLNSELLPASKLINYSLSFSPPATSAL
jgi:hypothetical protein